MDASEQLQIGRALLENRILQPTQLQALLKEQFATGKPLAELVVERRIVTREQLEAVLSMRRAASDTKEVELQRREDAFLGKVLALNKLAAAEHVAECLKDQTASSPGQPLPRLGELLIRRGYITLDRLNQGIAALHRGLLECAGCGAPHFVAQYDAAKAYSCRKCSAGLRPVYPDAIPAHLRDSSRGISHVLKADAPEQVRQAATDPKNVFGKYILLERIGRGGMGLVRRAWDTELNRAVALKFLLQTEDEDVQRFAREAQTAAKLSHPNIIPVYEVGSIGEKFFIAMEYVKGRTLEDLKPDRRRAVEIARDAALALQHAHSQGIVHRDIKPQNLMIRDDGRVYVMDFGLARQVRGPSALTQTGTVVGTPTYMSPEQAKGIPKDIDHRTDIYALGATLYTAVTGRLPFGGETPLEIIQKVVNDDPVRPRRIDASIEAGLENIILKAIAKEKDARYQTMDEFAADLERYLKGEAVHARRMKTRRREETARKRPAAIVAGIVLAGLVAGAFLLVFARKDDRAEVARLLQQANARFDEEKYQEALELYSRAAQLRPKDATVQGRIQSCRAKIDEAKIAAERRTREETERRREEEARRQEEERRRREEETKRRDLEEKMKERERRTAEAKPHFDKGMRTMEDAARDLYRPGADLNRMRDRLKEAIESFDEALRIFPDHHDAAYGRGRARVLRFEYAAAEQDFSRAIELAPNFTSAYAERGKLAIQRAIEARLDLGWVWDDAVAARFRPLEEQARKDFEEAVKTGAEEQRESFQALRAFVRGELAECVEACERSLDRNPSQEEIHKLLADAIHFSIGSTGPAPGERERQMLQQAVQHYTEALKLRVNYYEARIMRANEFHLLGRPDRMREDVEAALAQRPDDPLGCWMMGLYFGDQGNAAQALEWYERGLAVKPDSFANRVNRAAQLGLSGRFEEALAEAERASKGNPAHYHVWYLMGAVKSKTGDWAGAAADLEKSASLYPNFYSAWYNLGAVYTRQERWRDAVSAFERALALGHPKREEIEGYIQSLRRKLGE